MANTINSIRESQREANDSILLSVRLTGPILNLWLNLKETDLSSHSTTKIIHEAIACRAFFAVQESEQKKISTVIKDNEGKEKRISDVAKYLNINNDQ